MGFLEIMGILFLSLIAFGVALFLAMLLACACGFLEEDNPPPMVEYKGTFHDEVGEMVEFHKTHKEELPNYQIIRGEGIDN